MTNDPKYPVVRAYVLSPKPSGNIPGSTDKWLADEDRKIRDSIQTLVSAILDLRDRLELLGDRIAALEPK